MECDKVEYLANYCAKTDCKDKKFIDCDVCMYEKGRLDAIDECITVIYNNDNHCILDECKSSNNYSVCLYLVISNKLEQLKE